ncbi:hypothetical protein [Burkholderia cepacia]|uniref:hypothetical protein n=1 Tax=Burkholderia cepacia TaxID=292 RepID=UPI00398E313C
MIVEIGTTRSVYTSRQSAISSVMEMDAVEKSSETEMKHLQQLAPEMFAMLERTGEQHLRLICFRVCGYAVSHNRPLDPIAELALESLGATQSMWGEMLADLESLMNRLDEEYFDAAERADEIDDIAGRNQLIAQSIDLFRKARAVAALRSTAGSNAFEAASETIYEAAASVADKDAVFEIVKHLLAS